MASSSVSARQRLERALEFLDPFDGRVRPLVRHRTEGSESLHLRAHGIMPPHGTPLAPKCRSLGGDPPLSHANICVGRVSKVPRKGTHNDHRQPSLTSLGYGTSVLGQVLQNARPQRPRWRRPVAMLASRRSEDSFEFLDITSPSGCRLGT